MPSCSGAMHPRAVAAAQLRPHRAAVIFIMKKCKSCNSPLVHIDDIGALKRPLSDEIGRSVIDGLGTLILFILIGLLVSMPLWKSHGILAAIIISSFSAIGAYLFQKPRKFYRCTNCGAEFYGKNLLIFKR